MKAEILSIGTEILLGEIVDTNAQYIASRLPGLGIDLYFKAVVGDNLDRLTETIGRARERSDVVICTGGLGPTEDDLTREAISAALGEEPRVDPQLERDLRGFFERRGYTMPERNVKQCWLIPSARAIPNPRGTAPGWWVERDGKIIVAMPGPPTEMTRMWEREVAPELLRRNPGSVLITRTLKTTGIGEGTVDEMVSPLLKSTNPSIGIYARADGVHLRIAAKAPTAGGARALIAPVEEDARGILGPAVWGADDDTFESVVGEMMRARGVTLATMESCTGGLLASTLTDVPGASDYFRGGLVAYQTELKVAWGVPRSIIDEHGVISAECARAMAQAARERLEASIGIGVTCVAGPDEQEGKPVGTVHIGIDAVWAAPQAVSYVYPQGRMAAKRRAVTSALGLLRQSLLGYTPAALV
ncbi:MAG: competence/damage-inducible protein A [Chloroflexota bacterium]|nr:competence/damage-inducible protein A [Chloroflexota bacterium]